MNDIDPFFDYIEQDRDTVSSELYAHNKRGLRHAYQIIKLPRRELPKMSLQEALHSRTSAKVFDSTAPFHINDLATLLEYAYGYRKDDSRTFPSAGGMYSQTLFVMVQNVAGLKQGLYQYDPKRHLLGLIHKEIPSKETLSRALYYEKFSHAAAYLYLVMFKSQNIKKYGSYTYAYSFLEAGHIGQNVYLIATALNVSCCAMGSARYHEINSLLDISGTAANYTYGFALGVKDSIENTEHVL